jgi:hypothetical protein
MEDIALPLDSRGDKLGILCSFQVFINLQFLAISRPYCTSLNSLAEDFIALSATKSELSGKKYRIFCEGTQPLDSDRLLGELKEYRR